MDTSDNEDYSNDVQSDDDLGYYTESEEGKQDQGISEATWFIIDANEISVAQVTAPMVHIRTVQPFLLLTCTGTCTS